MRRKRNYQQFDPEVQPLSDFIFEPSRTWESRNYEDTQPILVHEDRAPSWRPNPYPTFTDPVSVNTRSILQYGAKPSDESLKVVPSGVQDYILAFLSWEMPSHIIRTARTTLREPVESNEVEVLYDGALIRTRGTHVPVFTPAQRIQAIFDIVDDSTLDIEQKLEAIEKLQGQ